MSESKSKLLLVDDIPKNIQVLANTLENENCVLAFATNGVDALNHIERDYFDLVLLDISMPEMDGFEVCRRLKASEKHKDLPIIFITAFDDKESIVKGFELGAVDYVTKPFNNSELLARVRTQLKLKSEADMIKQLNETLEEKVEQRTRELFIANSKLEVLEKAKSDFLTLISHELRTPLNGIKGFAEILEETVTDEESKEFVKYLSESADRLIRFSESALLVTSLQAKKIEINYKKDDFVDLVKSVVEKRKNDLDSKSIQINYEVESINSYVEMDAELISKTVENILENAIEYSPENETIQISIFNEGSNIVAAIKDNGPGFSEEAKKELFNFLTSDNVMNHSEGFGLGLAAAKLILDAHSGRVEVSNSVKGADVRLYLSAGDI